MNVRPLRFIAPLLVLVGACADSYDPSEVADGEGVATTETTPSARMSEPISFASPQQSADLIASLIVVHGLGPDHGMKISVEHPGASGTKVTRLHHTYKGVRVWQSESVVVTDSAHHLLSESISERRHGLGTPAPGARAAAREFDVRPTLSSKAAIDLVVTDLNIQGTLSSPPSAELLIYPIMKTERVASAIDKAEEDLNAFDVEDKVTGYELAYLVKTRVSDRNDAHLFDSIISAHDGRLLQRIDAKRKVIGTGNSQYNGTVPIVTSFNGSTYQMIDTTRGAGGTYGGLSITNASHTASAGSVYSNSTNTWGDGQQYISGGSTTNANGQTAAVNALWGAMNTYDTLKNVLGWNSLDGQNTAFYIAVHVGTAYDNAYYDDACKCMFIGDGSMFYSLGAIDVIGHEMGHGVTAATSDLTYSGESGGLNESSSDITGEVVEAYARNGGTGTTIPVPGANDWEVGKEISKTNVGLRHMKKPSKDGSSPDAWSSALGNLDVHYSSGPNNRMFYFLSQGSNATAGNDAYSSFLTKCPRAMTGIGNDKAYRIWFNALTTRFTASTNYADARNKMVAAAQALYGVGSREDIAAQRAYAAINVGVDVDEPGATGCSTGAPLAISSQPSSVSVAVGGTANFSVTASGGTTPYKYQWRRNGTTIIGATSQTYSLASAQSTDNGAVFSVVITDSATIPASVTSSNATLTVTWGGSSLELVANGGFESGATSWTGNTAVIGSWSGQPAYEGLKNAWLGGHGSAITETIYTSINIPSTAATASFTFAMHIGTAETTTTTTYDRMTVKVLNSTGTTLFTLATYSNLDKNTGYTIKTFDLSAYKGLTIRLQFSATEDSSMQTSFVIDKVSVK